MFQNQEMLRLRLECSSSVYKFISLSTTLCKEATRAAQSVSCVKGCNTAVWATSTADVPKPQCQSLLLP